MNFVKIDYTIDPYSDGLSFIHRFYFFFNLNGIYHYTMFDRIDDADYFLKYHFLTVDEVVDKQRWRDKFLKRVTANTINTIMLEVQQAYCGNINVDPCGRGSGVANFIKINDFISKIKQSIDREVKINSLFDIQ